MMVIDLHGHCTPLAYIRSLLGRTAYPRAVADGDGYRVEVGEGVAYRATTAHYDLAARIPVLDAAEVHRQALSLSCPYGFELLSGDEAVAVADATNEALITAAMPFGDRFVPLATAPVDGSGAGLEALRRALAAGHRGLILSASVVALLADDAVLAPYLKEVAAAGGFVLLHPGARVHAAGLPDFPYALSVAGFQNELTVALFRLLFGGLLDAVPDLTVVSVNLGGAVPLLAERMRSSWENRDGEGVPPDERFRRAYYDYSSFREHSLEAAVAVLGAGRIVFGTDYPIQGLDRPLQVLQNARIDDDAHEAIRHRNAESFLR
jgi:predicted TIM-barrel fold metal-dependent hydrolase